MKIIIFGATGTVGLELVKQSLQNGDQVTAFVRTPEKLQHLAHPDLTIFRGNVMNLNDVKKAMQAQQAVICALGDGRIGTVRASGTQNIIVAMKHTGIKRLICQTTLGMGESYGNLNFIWKHLMFGMLLKKAFKDHQIQEQYLWESGLDYTIVRPSALTGGEITNHYKVGFDADFKKLTLKISRSDVASFMLGQLKTDQYLHQAVSISN